ncbi:MAG: bifunctional oligoribonuclease/PAP phosphatase NrnA [bacterium]
MKTILKKTKTNTIPEILKVIRKAKSVLISGHVRPDGDSLGSMIALAHLLNRESIRTVAVAEQQGLGGPGFLRGIELLVSPKDAPLRKHDLLITLDSGSIDRLPDEVQAIAKKCTVICIDHHITNTRFGAYNWIDGKASSTGEMIWHLAQAAKWELDDIAAEALWVAVVTDTGRFAYDMTKSSTLLCGADLLRYGVRTSFINDKLYASFSVTNIELKKRAFRTFNVLKNGQIAYLSLSGKDLAETNGTKADAEDIIDIPRYIAGNRIALFFYGSKNNKNETRVSIRTHEPLNAFELAKQFDGGGHPRAAGCTIYQPLPQARKTMLKAVKAFLKA